VIERVVENWLTSTTERGYQIPFTQILTLDGHRVLYISKHGQMEQGKDIITVDAQQVPCAYQLKTGNINLQKWREIEPQIHELVELPIAHPSIDKTVPFKAYLVTNGEIDDPVRLLIDNRNSWWQSKGLPSLHLVTKGELLRKFTDAHESFLPEGITSQLDFLELYLANGRDLVDKAKLAAFLEELLLRDSANTSNERLRQRIASAAVIAQCLIAPFEREQNHVGILESWVMFCAYVLALSERSTLPDQFWLPTFDLVIQRICEQLHDLKTELLARKNYLEQPTLGDGGFVYRARLTIVMGWLCAYELFRLANNSGETYDRTLLAVIQQKFKDWFWYWGESGTPFHLMASLFSQIADRDLSWRIILNMLVEACNGNGSEGSEIFLSNPYVPVDKIIEARMPFQQHSSNKELSGSGYHLATLIFYAAMLDKRTALNELWKKLSKIYLREYKAKYRWHYFIWRSNEGTEVGRFLNRTQSWSQLKELAAKREDTLPRILYDNPTFLFFFLLVYPHRLTPEAFRLLHAMASRAHVQ
jgi:hypothetical protein